MRNNYLLALIVIVITAAFISLNIKTEEPTKPAQDAGLILVEDHVVESNEKDVENHIAQPEKKVEEAPGKGQDSEPVRDPQGCEPEQYWAAEAPYDCIKKPTPTPTPEPVLIKADSPQLKSKPAPTPEPKPSVNIGGSKQDWMRAAGIPESDWWAVDFIVTRESSWNPNAVNPNGGACGLAQQLPCGKWSSYGPWNDPVAALTAQYDYVNDRYGGYSQAVAFWQVNHWY